MIVVFDTFSKVPVEHVRPLDFYYTHEISLQTEDDENEEGLFFFCS